MKKIFSIPFWLVTAMVGGVANIFVMTMPQQNGTLFSFMIGWLVYTLISSQRTEWKRYFLLIAAMLMILITYIGLRIICSGRNLLICQRSLLIVSSYSAFIPFLAWLILALLTAYRARNKSGK